MKIIDSFEKGKVCHESQLVVPLLIKSKIYYSTIVYVNDYDYHEYYEFMCGGRYFRFIEFRDSYSLEEIDVEEFYRFVEKTKCFSDLCLSVCINLEDCILNSGSLYAELIKSHFSETYQTTRGDEILVEFNEPEVYEGKFFATDGKLNVSERLWQSGNSYFHFIVKRNNSDGTQAYFERVDAEYFEKACADWSDFVYGKEGSNVHSFLCSYQKTEFNKSVLISKSHIRL